MAERKGRRGRLCAANGYRRFERRNLFVGHHEQEGLQEHNRFTEAGIQIEVTPVKRVPKSFSFQVDAADQFVGGLAEFVVQVADQFPEGRRLVDKLRPLRQKNTIQESGDSGRALAARSPEILWIERRRIWNEAEMLGVLVESGKQQLKGL
ncbi:MAG TPA: hypothetical protein VKP58_11880 [Candidatus Acidoferrum sp.]|nr:hypothetical protein [Candidatus Acidoferrum sp.]